jgi:predicted enzyme involved in methoxymalonyl-ACP biosynthesis
MIDSWVMSCRAFSRLIEHRCLEEIFSRTGSERIELCFERTERNGPLREFVESVGDFVPGQGVVVERAKFEQHKPVMHMHTENA